MPDVTFKPGILWIRQQTNTADARTEYVVGYRNTTSEIAWFRHERDAKLFVKARHEDAYSRLERCLAKEEPTA